MEEIKKRYDELVKERSKVIDRLNVLEKHKIIKEYNELRALNTTLIKKLKECLPLLEVDNYNECDHLLVNTYNVDDYHYYGCIKCGLHDDVLATFDTNNIVMFSYLADEKNITSFRSAKKINESCDLDLAHAIYKKIVNAHPNIDDDTLIEYFENSLNHIRNKNVDDEKNKNRAKRLHLKNSFYKWN